MGGMSDALQALGQELSPGAMILDADIVASYSRDHSEYPARGAARALVRAVDSDDVRYVLRFATAHGIPVAIRGAGSGLAGGSNATDGCLILSVDRMRAISIDPATQTATVQPGAINADVKAAAAQHGLWYPPDPASYEFCSIGGNVATNAGGLCCVKYGVTSGYVLGLTVVLADGRTLQLGGPRVKDVAGLSLTQLFVGSEGVLGVITEVVLRLIPATARPLSLIATFGELDAAVSAVLAVRSSTRPSMLELMDRATIGAVEDMTRMGLDRTAAAMLVIQSDAAGGQAGRELAEIERLCHAQGATECVRTDDPEDSEAFVAARRVALTAVEAKGAVLLEDAGVPLPQLAALTRGIARISRERDIPVALMAHAGDGNTHPMIVFDRGDAASARRAQEAFDAIMELAISLGGTISGEHGVGRLKQPWLPRQLGDDVTAVTRTVKEAFDPQWLLNPGVLVTRGDH